MNQTLRNWLEQHHIQYNLYSHRPVFTVAEAQKWCAHVPGLACKNLFLKDSKTKKYYLLSTPSLKSIRINEVRKIIGAKKLHFASSEDVKNILGLIPGGVSPIGLLHPLSKDVIYLIDDEIWEADCRSFHPDTNTESLTFDQDNFQRFVGLLP